MMVANIGTVALAATLPAIGLVVLAIMSRRGATANEASMPRLLAAEAAAMGWQYIASPESPSEYFQVGSLRDSARVRVSDMVNGTIDGIDFTAFRHTASRAWFLRRSHDVVAVNLPGEPVRLSLGEVLEALGEGFDSAELSLHGGHLVCAKPAGRRWLDIDETVIRLHGLSEIIAPHDGTGRIVLHNHAVAA